MNDISEAQFQKMREEMVATQLEARGITDQHVLDVMRKIPRHLFVPEALRAQAYADHPITLGEGSTISQPYIVAYMLEHLSLGPNDKVLEVGTGSGYQTALLAELAGTVYSIEINPTLSANATKLLGGLGYRNIFTRVGNGLIGWDRRAPFDAIIVAAATEEVPRDLVKQMGEHGRLIFPIEGDPQYLILLERKNGEIATHELCSVRFVSAQAPKGGDSH